jgi:hypothetical protein
MESIIFDYIGYVFIFCAALCVAAPLVVYIVSFVVGVVWKVIDEGDSESPNILKKVMPFLYVKGNIICLNGFYSIQNSWGMYYDPNDKKFWKTIYYARSDIKEVESTLQAMSARFAFENIFIAFCCFMSAGVGFVLIPTITMYLLSSALCLLSLRWSRRGYKKVKKLKVALDNHAKDKEAHK